LPETWRRLNNQDKAILLAYEKYQDEMTKTLLSQIEQIKDKDDNYNILSMLIILRR
jgi:hypothetical protein